MSVTHAESVLLREGTPEAIATYLAQREPHFVRRLIGVLVAQERVDVFVYLGQHHREDVIGGPSWATWQSHALTLAAEEGQLELVRTLLQAVLAETPQFFNACKAGHRDVAFLIADSFSEKTRNNLMENIFGLRDGQVLAMEALMAQADPDSITSGVYEVAHRSQGLSVLASLPVPVRAKAAERMFDAWQDEDGPGRPSKQRLLESALSSLLQDQPAVLARLLTQFQADADFPGLVQIAASQRRLEALERRPAAAARTRPRA